MPITQQQQKVIHEINSLTYEQYNSGWCKVIPIKNLVNYSSDKDLIHRFLQEPQSLNCCKAMITLFIDDNLPLYTPESFCYNYKLLKADWQRSENNAHLKIIDRIVDHSFFHIQEQIKEKENERNEWLSYWGLKNMQEFEKAPKALQDEINLPKMYEHLGFTPQGTPWLDFTEYDLLKKCFLEYVFDNRTLSFFVNMNLSKVNAVLKSKKDIPAVIGLDASKVGLFWFNY